MLERLFNNGLLNRSAALRQDIQEDVKKYVPNESLPRARETLEDQHVCIVAGVPGIGKTLLAKVLALEYAAAGFDIVEVSSDIAEAFDLLNPDVRQFFFYDDFLGQTNLAELQKNEDDRLLRFIRQAKRSGNTRLAMTTREYILQKARATHQRLADADLDLETCILSLEDYSRMARAEILYNHLYFSSLPDRTKDQLSDGRLHAKAINHPNFSPRIIDAVVVKATAEKLNGSKLIELLDDTLQNPDLLWDIAFQKTLTDAEQLILYAMTSLPRQVDLKDLHSASHALAAHRGLHVDAAAFRSALKTLDGTFVETLRRGDITVASFHNPSIRDYMLGLLDKDPDMVVDLFAAASFFEQCDLLWRYAHQPRLNNLGRIEDLITARTFDGVHSAIYSARRKVAASYERLYKADSCSLRSIGSNRFVKEAPSTEARLYQICRVQEDLQDYMLMEWIANEARTVGRDWEDDVGDSFVVVDLIASLDRVLADDPSLVDEFKESVKSSLISFPQSTQDLVALRDLDENYPGLLDPSERGEAGDAILDFVQWDVPHLIGSDNRYSELASAIDEFETVAEWFSVDVDPALVELREHTADIGVQEDWADEVQRDTWSAPVTRGGNADGDSGLIEGLFGTLGD